MLNFDITIPDIEDLKKNALRAATADALQDACGKWTRKELPRRFTAGAAKRYGWAVRSKLYMIRKAKRKGTQADLVWSGSLKATVLSTARATASRKTIKAKITFDVTPHADVKRKRTNTSVRQEIGKLIAGDVEAIYSAVREDLPRRLAEDPRYRVKRKPKKRL